jgi:hypothetical protein
MVEVLKSHQIGSKIIDNIDAAVRECVLVTAYSKPWEHLKERLERAVKRGVQVTVYVREPDQENIHKVKDVASELSRLGVKMYTVPNLHAKIYLFDDIAMIGSMNLYDYSQANSIDFAVQTCDQATVEATKAFVCEYVQPKAKLLEVPGAKAARRVSEASSQSRGAQPAAEAAKTVGSTILGALADGVTRLLSGGATGHCIRCGTPIADDINKPLCEDHYKSWANYRNRDFPEKYCLGCGKEWSTTYAKPYCRKCFQERSR